MYHEKVSSSLRVSDSVFYSPLHLAVLGLVSFSLLLCGLPHTHLKYKLPDVDDRQATSPVLGAVSELRTLSVRVMEQF